MRSRTLATSIAVCVFLVIGVLSAAPSPAALGQTYILNFQDAELLTVAESVAAATGRKLMFHPAIPLHEHITLVSEQPLDAAGMYSAFALALVDKGYVVEEFGGVVKVFLGKAGKPQD